MSIDGFPARGGHRWHRLAAIGTVFAAWILLRPEGEAQAVLWQYNGIPGSFYGWRLAGVGDLNGDGVGDLAVGAPQVQGGWTYLHSGIDGTVLFYLLGPVPGGGLGNFVAAPGDVTGDGIPEILLGSTGGQARLHSGASGSLVFQWPGITVGPGEDFNGDGVLDVLVGMPLSGQVGAAYVYSGTDGSQMYGWFGSFPPERFGSSLTGLCDVSGDGVPDLLIGAPDVSQGPFPCGQGYANVYSGATGALIDQVNPSSPGCHLTFGAALARLRDVTGDGICDFAIADRNEEEVLVYSGADRSLVTTLQGTYTPAWFGDVIASGGDVDGDGVEDLIVGAPYAAPAIPNVGASGRALVFSGDDWSILFDLAPSTFELLEFGRGVDGVGDVNGDGFPDLAVGAAGAYNQPNCKVRVISGAPIGVATIGVGCAGSSGSPPRIGATRSPKIGTTFKVNLSETPPGRPALLLLGFSDTQWWGVPLPLSLAAQGMPACSLLVSPDLVFGLTTAAFGPANGRLVAPMAIPPSSSLVGLVFYTQWYVVDPGPAPIPGAMTRGLAVTIQS